MSEFKPPRVDRVDLSVIISGGGLMLWGAGSHLLAVLCAALLVCSTGLGRLIWKCLPKPHFTSLPTPDEMDRRENLHIDSHARMSRFKWQTIASPGRTQEDILKELARIYTLRPEIIRYSIDWVPGHWDYNGVWNERRQGDFAAPSGEVVIYFFTRPGDKRDGSYCADDDNHCCSDYGCCPWECPKNKVPKVVAPAEPYVPFWDDPRIHEVEPPQPSAFWFQPLDWTDKAGIMAQVRGDSKFWKRVYAKPKKPKKEKPAALPAPLDKGVTGLPGVTGAPGVSMKGPKGEQGPPGVSLRDAMGPMEDGFYRLQWLVGVKVIENPATMGYTLMTPSGKETYFDSMRDARDVARAIDRHEIEPRLLERLSAPQIAAIREFIG